jgi:hypothetical protein
LYAIPCRAGWGIGFNVEGRKNHQKKIKGKRGNCLALYPMEGIMPIEGSEDAGEVT